LNLRTRFFLVLFGLGLIILAASALSLYAVGYRQIVRAQDAAKAETLDRVAGVCREAAIGSNDITAIDFFKLLRKDPGVAYAGCLDAEGRFRAHTNPALIGETFPAGGGLARLRLTRPVEVRGSTVGTAVVQYDEDRLAAEVRRRLLELTLGIASAVSIVLPTVVLGGAVLLARSLADPIAALEGAASEFGRGNFDYEVPASERRDEVGGLARSLTAMARRLGELDRLKQSFLQQITHDLRLPLTSIHGYAEMISEGTSGPVTPKQIEQLRAVQESSDRLGEYIDDILDLAKLEAGGMTVERKPVALESVLRSAAVLLDAGVIEHGIRLDIRCEPELPLVPADADLLRRAAANLLGNALKFTPKGGSITVEARRDDPGAVRVSVSDTGPGIPQEKLEKVFDKFFQVTETKGVARQAGTGLGLTIAREIVQAHGGKIWAQSEPGRGATFIFTLPVG